MKKKNPRYFCYPRPKEIFLDVTRKIGKEASEEEVLEEEIKKADEAVTSIDPNNNPPSQLKKGDCCDE